MASLIRSGFGALSKINDLVIRLPESRIIKERVVYFGGDIQDVERSMRHHVSKRDFVDWSLEATAEILAKRFGPYSVVVIVRPSEYYLDVFSVFRNFVASDEHSNPTFEKDTDKAWRQLDSIMEKVRSEVETAGVVSAFDAHPITLIGFSKGCAVLNQLVHEFIFIRERTPEKRSDLKTPRAVHEMFWLDGGHNGESDTWVTDPAVLKAFSEYYKNRPMKLFVHVTPYQMNDIKRPQIKRHKLQFCEIVRGLGMALHDETHFQNQKCSIETHFEVLTTF